MTKNEFVAMPTENNIEWAAQQIADDFGVAYLMVHGALKGLDAVLYKSWAKDLSLRDLLEACERIEENVQF